MKIARKLLLTISIVLFAFVIVPNVVPIVGKVFSIQAASVKLNKTKLTMNTKEKYTLKLKGNKKKVKWTTSKKSIATVTSKGKVTAKKKGNVKITAKVGGKKYTCKVKVEAPKISNTYITLQKGNTFQLKVKGTSQKVTWSTNSNSIAKISSKGVVTAVNSGTATITAKVGNTKYKCNVTVPKPDYASKIQVNYTRLPDNSTLISIKNNNSCKIDDVEVDVFFYKNGRLIDSTKAYTSVLPSGATAYDIVNNPFDYNSYNYVDFDSIQTNVSNTYIYEYFNHYNLKGSVSISHNKGINGVVGTVRNIGSRKIEAIEVTAIYYKNGKIIGASKNSLYELNAGASTALNLSNPYDSDYNDLSYDTYTINVDYAYGY